MSTQILANRLVNRQLGLLQFSSSLSTQNRVCCSYRTYIDRRNNLHFHPSWCFMENKRYSSVKFIYLSESCLQFSNRSVGLLLLITPPQQSSSARQERSAQIGRSKQPVCSASQQFYFNLENGRLNLLCISFAYIISSFATLSSSFDFVKF